MQGEDVGVDMNVIEHLRDPLTHIVRNAVDHGIEPPARRSEAGKDPCGRILLRAWHEGGSIVIQVQDDGAGLDRARIIERARAMGYTSDLDKMSDADIYRLILDAGFSTASAVTEYSGRGVINLRGQALPYLRLRECFRLGGIAPTRENVLVLRLQEQRVGLVVDRLFGESQTVIKPLGRVLGELPGVSGSAILGNGRVALILDVEGLLREALRTDVPAFGMLPRTALANSGRDQTVA
jgi:chemotaxis protein histidine kinase CheA